MSQECLVIRGGPPLHGTAEVSGSKNAALPIMAASLLAEAPVLLDGVPQVVDVETLVQLLERLGVSVTRRQATGLALEVRDEANCQAEADLVGRMRASFCVLGPLLAKRRRAVVPLPGGCRIGHRPVDLHLKGLRAMGAQITIEHNQVIARAPRLHGAAIDLTGPHGSTVTGTCNVLSAAVLAEGESWIQGAAREPEVVDFGRFLCSLGAEIEGLGSSAIRVKGVHRLGGTSYRVIPDRIEAGTLMTAAAITRGQIELSNVRCGHLRAVITKLRSIGLTIKPHGEHLHVRGEGLPLPTALTARPYPGIPSDLQAQLTALLAVVPGRSRVQDEVFPERFHHVAQLQRMGARIERRGNQATVTGVPRLGGAEVVASDLRASAALVVASLAAEGETVIHQIHHLKRGYERLDAKLRALGADIRTKVPEEPPPGRRAA